MAFTDAQVPVPPSAQSSVPLGASLSVPLSLPLIGGLPALPHAGSIMLPVPWLAKQRNTALDWFFYDVFALSTLERVRLVHETNLEGAILVVHPSGRPGEQGVKKFDDHAALRDAPGRMLERFTIAGVGSSDVGAAAFARAVADHYGEPVGAIIAGYGVTDVLAEALGGWFVMGLSNRLMQAYHDREGPPSEVLDRLQASIPDLDRTRASAVAERVTGSPDSDTLLKLLLDEDRAIRTLIGHSKGCLSISYALQALALSGATEALARAREIACVTTGAVVEFPDGFDRVVQFLGELDWFGGLNSRKDVAFQSVPNAWHHFNRAIPYHMNLSEILENADA